MFGSVDIAEQGALLRDITTRGDGAIGMQFSKPFGKIAVDGDIRTKGGEGDSLVRGKVVHMKAFAPSLKPGTSGDVFKVSGKVVAENAGINDLDFEAPASVIGSFEINGKRLA